MAGNPRYGRRGDLIGVRAGGTEPELIAGRLPSSFRYNQMLTSLMIIAYESGFAAVLRQTILVPTIAEARVMIRHGDETDSPGDRDRLDHRGA